MENAMNRLFDPKRFLCFNAGIAMLWVFLATSTVLTVPFAGAQVKAATPAEQFVLDELKTNGEADFDESNLKDRSLRHDFVEALITASPNFPAVSAHGIHISNANIQGELNLTNASIPFPLRFSRCNLPDGVDFSYDQFAYDLSIDKSKVGTSKTSALFIGIKVAGGLNLTGTYFYSPVNFTYASVGSELLSDDVHYESSETADFDSIKTVSPVFFRKSHFAGKLYLGSAELFSLQIEDALPQAAGRSDQPGTIDVDLNETHITHSLEIDNTTLKVFQAGFLQVDGPTMFKHVVPLGRIDLNHSHFRNLTIDGFENWLPKHSSANFWLEGLSFDGLDIPDAAVKPTAIRMLDLFNNSNFYSPQPYLVLEKFLRDHGNPDEADQTYIDMRRRERTQLSAWKRPFDWILSALVGYGRQPWRSVLCALFLVLVGAVIFRSNRMEPDDAGSTDQWYNPFWFSLDLISPIDLGVANRWRARNPLIRNYAQIHRVAGWVLIPLIAAAITGIIK